MCIYIYIMASMYIYIVNISLYRSLSLYTCICAYTHVYNCTMYHSPMMKKLFTFSESHTLIFRQAGNWHPEFVKKHDMFC